MNVSNNLVAMFGWNDQGGIGLKTFIYFTPKKRDRAGITNTCVMYIFI